MNLVKWLSAIMLLVCLFDSEMRASSLAEQRELTEVLDEFSEIYQVFFTFNSRDVEKVMVDFEFRKDEDINSAITRLLSKTDYAYEVYGDKYYVIYSRTPRGIRSAKKLGKHLREIEKIEKEGVLQVDRKQSDPLNQIRSVDRTVGSLEMAKPDKHALAYAYGTTFTGELRGSIVDGVSGSPLPSATIMVIGTSIGTAADLDGVFRLTGIPSGMQQLSVSYIGYDTDTVEVEIVDNDILEIEIPLNPVAVMGEIVIVSAQREGQNAAINQQVKSNQIINVVSAERIQELPDENAAESVGRLPGVSVSRSGGEGQRVNIRGLSPKFSSVSVDGVRIPATGQGRRVFSIAQGGGQPNYTPSLDDRSVDLSMISSQSLAGIEVYKSLTPDQDGDAIGGKVNFVTKKAPAGSKYLLDAQLGHNFYFGTTQNLKFNGLYSNRFLNNKLGVIATGGYSTVDRSSDADEVDYEFRGGTTLNGLTTFSNMTTRDRYNASIVFDYDIGEQHEFTLSGMYARTDVENMWRNNRVGSLSNSATWSAGHNKSNINLMNFSLGAKHGFQILDVDWKVNYVQTQDENPFSYSYGFGEPNPLTNVDLPRQDPYLTMEYTNFDPVTATGAVPGGGANNKRVDKNWIAQVNLQRDIRLAKTINGFLKFGGKLQAKDRSRRRTNGTGIQGRRFIEEYLKDYPESIVDRQGISAANFLDDDVAIEPFFNEKYPFPLVLRTDEPKRLFDEYRHLRVDNLVSGQGDYEAFENIYAGYLMADLTLGRRITFVGGVRYEYSDNNYAAYEMINYSEVLSNDGTSFSKRGTIDWLTSEQNYGEWLPMFNAKFQLLQSDDNSNGIDIRLATTRTITRPDYYNLTPFQNFNVQSSVITRSEPTLLPTLGWNYDAFLTLFNNKFGLLTIGGFYKELENIDFLYNRILEQDQVLERFGEYGISGAYSVIEPLNATGITTVKGYEIELQTNLAFLPSPFDGIVLYGNFSQIASRAIYPFRISVFNLETLKSELIDTSRILQMPGQSDEIANFSIGYEKGWFSGRVSWNYQGPSLAVLSSNEELDVWTDEFSRIDVSVKFKISDHWSIFTNVTNLQNMPDRSFTGTLLLPGTESIYGATGWVGVRYTGGKE